MRIKPRPIKPAGFHLAGVVPLSSRAFDFNPQWPSSLTWVDDDLSFVEFAIYKCLYAGCRTIWVALDKKGSTLIKERIGEYAKGDQKAFRPLFGVYHHYLIPIFYWPRRSPNMRKYDCASRVSRVMEKSRLVTGRHSSHVIPDRYFVSFPGSIYDPEVLREPRSKKITPKYMIENDGEVVSDGRILDFICDFEDQNRFENVLKRENAGFVRNDDARESGMGLEEVFGKTEEEKRIVVDECYEINDWESYRDFMGSNFEFDLERRDLVSGDYTYREVIK